MYKSLAAHFDGKLAFGEARSNQDIASVVGVERCTFTLKIHLHQSVYNEYSTCMTFETCSGLRIS